MTRRAAAVVAAAATLVLLPAAAATAAQPRAQSQPPGAQAPGLVRPASLDRPPPGRVRSGAQVAVTAAADDRVSDVIGGRDDVYRDVFLRGARTWQVSWFDQGGEAGTRREIAQAVVDDRSGRVTEAWTGVRVAWTMGRGYDGEFGRAVNAPWVWALLLAAFAVPFADRRRLRSWRNLDLLVLSAFSLSYALFADGRIEASVPTVYPLLGYLLVRMLALGLGRGPGAHSTPPALPAARWLAGGLAGLVALRLGLNLADSNVIDVGYSGVIGADRLAAGDPLYGGWPADDAHGDTYGPLAYLAYVPFEQLLPWNGTRTDLAAAHAAAIAFDLLTIGALVALGRRLRDRTLGLALGYAWAAFPFTALTLSTNANDALVALALVGVLLAAASPPARGALGAVAALVKLAPAALLPVLATHGRAGRPRREQARRLAHALAAFALVSAAALLLLAGDLGTLWERTIAFQADRATPFSLWGLHDLGALQHIAQAAAVALAVGLAIVPRRGDTAGLAACCAAVLIALQLAAGYWFYLYLAWLLPLVAVALLAGSAAERVDERAPRPGRA